MHQLGFGRFESLGIKGGELVLDPWPTAIRSIKFGNAGANQPPAGPAGHALKTQIVELFAYVRSSESGAIRVLEIRGGLPFCMEIEEGVFGHPWPSSESGIQQETEKS